MFRGKSLLRIRKSYDVILIQPPLFKSSVFTDSPSDFVERKYWESMEVHSGRLLGDLPVEASGGILSIASYLDSLGYKVKIIDFHLLDYKKRREGLGDINQKDIIFELSKYISSLIGISVLTIAHEWSAKISSIAKKILPDSYVFWGGYYPTKNFQNILRTEKSVNSIVANEGEYTVKDIIDIHSRTNNKGCFEINKIDGIHYKSGNNIISTKIRNIINDINELPFLNYSLYDHELLEIIIPRVYSARGCSKKCSYCTADNAVLRTYRMRNPELVVDEIEHNYRIHDKKFFVMGDLEFLCNVKHARMICEEIIRRELPVRWWCQVFPPNISDSLVGLMKRAGVIQIALGIETNDVSNLAKLDKKISTGQELDAILSIKKHDIQIQVYVILGLPNDTIQSCICNIEHITDLIEKGLIDTIHYSVLVPYPGAQLLDDNDKHKIEILSNNPSDYFMNCDYLGSGVPAYQTSHMSRFEIYCVWLLALSMTEKKFKFNKSYRRTYRKIYEDLGILKTSLLIYPRDKEKRWDTTEKIYVHSY